MNLLSPALMDSKVVISKGTSQGLLTLHGEPDMAEIFLPEELVQLYNDGQIGQYIYQCKLRRLTLCLLCGGDDC